MVTIRSSIASFKRAFQATGSRQLLPMTLFLPILCTLICVSPCIVFCLTSLIGNTPLFSPCHVLYSKVSVSCLALSLCTIFDHRYFGISSALITPTRPSAAACCVLGSVIMDSFCFFTPPTPDTTYGNTHTPAFNRSLLLRASLTHACEKSH